MRERFQAPARWLPRFKELSSYEGKAHLECYRTSKWGIEVNLNEGPAAEDGCIALCLISQFKVNVRTNSILRTV